MKKKELIQTIKESDSKRFAQSKKVTVPKLNQTTGDSKSNQKSSKETKSKGNKSKK